MRSTHACRPTAEAPLGCCDVIAVDFPAVSEGCSTDHAFLNGTYVRTDNTSFGFERYLSCDGLGQLYSAASQGSSGRNALKWFMREDDGVPYHFNRGRTVRANNGPDRCPENGALNWQDRVGSNWVDWPVTITCHSRPEYL